MSRKRKDGMPPENTPPDYYVERDYHPFVEFAREVEGRPRKPPRLPPMTEAPPPPSKESGGTMRRRSTKHPWNEICGEIARLCIDSKTRCVCVPKNESKLASDVLQWCESTNRPQPADSDMREAVKAICAALRKI